MSFQQVTSPSKPARVIRVFVSSTFRDFQAEREELVKHIFPQLRKLCEVRGVVWGEVDLRWGITDEQKAEGHVLPICLTEIHNCRPYFIGLLGERYGWVPEDIPRELIEREPWLAEHRQHSVTELEILHGVLNNPEMAGHALFYFRCPDYAASLPPEMQSDFCEVATPDEIDRFGAKDAALQAEERKRKLVVLKQRIRSSGFPVKEGFPDAKALGELVLTDFTALINRLFPEGSQPNPLDREAAEHEAFATTRARVYIGRRDYFDRLDKHALSEGLPLVVLGESGLGKSALLANWISQYRAAHPDQLVVQHFIGATPASSDWAAMLRRILGEFNRRMGLRVEIPDKPEALRAAFANSLHMAAARGRVVLILDGLNHLEDRDQAPDLVWLPPVFPANVRLVLSTLPGRALDDLKRRNWPSLTIELLRPAEREQLIVDYLAQYTKALSPARVERIASAPQTANPLYLRALLEDLRIFGVYELLDQRIEHYLAAATADGLYQKILARFEQDYDRDRPELVRDAMALLWAARRGLSQAELLHLLGSNGEPLPGAIWSPLFLAAEQSLVARSGLIGFSHEYLRDAVRDRYLSTEEQQRAAHLRLADYFTAAEIGPRKVEELPWQLARAHSLDRLYDLLAAPEFFRAAWEANRLEVMEYWAEVESGSLQIVEAYRPVFSAPAAADESVLWSVGELLARTGHPAEAMLIRKYQISHYRRGVDRDLLQMALAVSASVLTSCGELDEAMRLLKEQEGICRELGDRESLQYGLGSQAGICGTRGRLDEAMSLFKEQERICRELGIKDCLQSSLGRQARIHLAREEAETAISLLKEAERICIELGDKDSLQENLGAHALILRTWGDLDAALAMMKDQERICRQLGNKYGLASSLGYQASIERLFGGWNAAEALHEEEERLCRELGNKYGLATSLGNQAIILHHRGKLDAALAKLREQEGICIDLEDIDGLSRSLCNQSRILCFDMQRPREALLLAQKAHQLATDLGLDALVQQSKNTLDVVRATAPNWTNLWGWLPNRFVRRQRRGRRKRGGIRNSERP